MLNLARGESPVMVRRVVQAPIQVFFGDGWNTVGEATTSSMRIVTETPSLIELEATWTPVESEGVVFTFLATHVFRDDGTWNVDTTIRVAMGDR